MINRGHMDNDNQVENLTVHELKLFIFAYSMQGFIWGHAVLSVIELIFDKIFKIT